MTESYTTVTVPLTDQCKEWLDEFSGGAPDRWIQDQIKAYLKQVWQLAVQMRSHEQLRLNDGTILKSGDVIGLDIHDVKYSEGSIHVSLSYTMLAMALYAGGLARALNAHQKLPTDYTDGNTFLSGLISGRLVEERTKRDLESL